VPGSRGKLGTYGDDKGIEHNSVTKLGPVKVLAVKLDHKSVEHN
jgi:hypothetical protein